LVKLSHQIYMIYGTMHLWFNNNRYLFNKYDGALHQINCLIDFLELVF